MVRGMALYQELIELLSLEKANCEACDKAVKMLRIMRYIHRDHRFMNKFNITTGGTKKKLTSKQGAADAGLHPT